LGLRSPEKALLLFCSSSAIQVETVYNTAQGGDMKHLSLLRFNLGADGKEDASLVSAAKHDQKAFAAIYDRYKAPIYRYLYSRVGNVAEAEDLTAQVFVAALEGLPRYLEQGSFAAWLFTIARHRLMDFYRSKRRNLPLAAAKNTPADNELLLGNLVHTESLHQLITLVTQLDEEKQELLRLRFAGNLTYAQIGEVVGRSEAAVKMSMQRLLQQLKRMWEADND
jgi:RNA polymerase sigma-70 factor, ECF subfamily